MSLEDAKLTAWDIAMLSYHSPEAVIAHAFRRAASFSERQEFIQRVATNGGDVLSAIIDTAMAAEADNPNQAPDVK